MARGQAKTEDQKRVALDKYYRKHYGWSLERVEQLNQLQGGVCAICGKPPKNTRLNVDHEHLKVVAIRTPLLRTWTATVTLKDGRRFNAMGATKAFAVATVRAEALPHSVRGLLCPGRHGTAGKGCCNRLLGRVDNIQWLQHAVAYLQDPPALKLVKSLVDTTVGSVVSSKKE